MKKLFILFTLLFSISLLKAQVVSDFEGGTTDGWQSEGDGEYLLEVSTGNPGDCLRINDFGTGAMNVAIAPQKFIGDWSLSTSSDSITFDVKVVTEDYSYTSEHWIFEISGPHGTAHYTSPNPHPALNTWESFTAYLDHNYWDVTEQSWNNILQQVDLIRVLAEYINGNEHVLIDNVNLSFTPNYGLVSPLVITDFENDTYDGWYFIDCGSTNVQSVGGNPNYCCRVNDQFGSLSKAIAPPKFLGNWTALENTAAFMVDIKTNQATVETGDYFIKISGPGGEAIVPTEPALAEAFNQWKTYSYRINESTWEIQTGTWTDLLSDVQEIQLVLEYTSNTDIVYFDNARISNENPIVDFSVEDQYICSEESIQFYDQTLGAPISWIWNFGDGFTSTEQNPIHTFLEPGIYNIELTASNLFGTDGLMKTNFIEVIDSCDDISFFDDFDDYVIGPSWDFINGTWEESSGLMQENSNEYGPGWEDGCYAITGCSSFENYQLEVEFLSTDNDGIGSVIYYQDPENFYLFVWRKQTSERAIYKYVNGVETLLASDAVAYNDDQWYHLKLGINNGIISCNIDDTEIFNVTDTSLLAGRAGLFSWANRISKWDNFSLTKLHNLPIPQNIVIVENSETIQINWDAVTGATSYSIYSSTEPSADVSTWSLEQSGITGTNWSELPTETKKFYYVKAIQ